MVRNVQDDRGKFAQKFAHRVGWLGDCIRKIEPPPVGGGQGSRVSGLTECWVLLYLVAMVQADTNSTMDSWRPRAWSRNSELVAWPFRTHRCGIGAGNAAARTDHPPADRVTPEHGSRVYRLQQTGNQLLLGWGGNEALKSGVTSSLRTSPEGPARRRLHMRSCASPLLHPSAVPVMCAFAILMREASLVDPSPIEDPHGCELPHVFLWIDHHKAIVAEREHISTALSRAACAASLIVGIHP